MNDRPTDIVWLTHGSSGGPLLRASYGAPAIGCRTVIASADRLRQLDGLSRFRIMQHELHRWFADRPDTHVVADAGMVQFLPADTKVTTLGFATSPEHVDLDLDEWPLHPWATIDLPTRQEARQRFGFGDDERIVAVLSPSWHANLFHPGAVRGDFRVVTPSGPNAALQFLGADLVVSHAGWATTIEAKACGAPYELVPVLFRDQHLRATRERVDSVWSMLRRWPWPAATGTLTRPLDGRDRLRSLVAL